ncbi:hypothetical protein [Desulfovibrio sp. ZJ200]|uniref:hypothetical protein n=1 Tax=Desulfovibrio sp. ZJ200 TaxID=2709792 RepID=UPI00197D06F4|nr:hypothetical protein [Desulfovibrio sp. ZJ200]
MLSPSVASFVATAEAWTRNDGGEVIENGYFQSKSALYDLEGLRENWRKPFFATTQLAIIVFWEYV